MTTSPHPQPVGARSAQAKRRRWGVIVIGVLLGLSVYALGLAWAARHLESSVQKSIHPLPVAMPGENDGNRAPE